MLLGGDGALADGGALASAIEAGSGVPGGTEVARPRGRRSARRYLRLATYSTLGGCWTPTTGPADHEDGDDEEAEAEARLMVHRCSRQDAAWEGGCGGR